MSHHETSSSPSSSSTSSSPSTSSHQSPLNWRSSQTANTPDDSTTNRIEQLVQGVLDFSSQYGSDSSISFTAHNITGAPSKFPEYGDFPETFAMVRFIFQYNLKLIELKRIYFSSEHMEDGGKTFHRSRPK